MAHVVYLCPDRTYVWLSPSALHRLKLFTRSLKAVLTVPNTQSLLIILLLAFDY